MCVGRPRSRACWPSWFDPREREENERPRRTTFLWRAVWIFPLVFSDIQSRTSFVVHFPTAICAFLVLGGASERALADVVEDPVDRRLTWLRGDGAESRPTATTFSAKVEEHLGG